MRQRRHGIAVPDARRCRWRASREGGPSSSPPSSITSSGRGPATTGPATLLLLLGHATTLVHAVGPAAHFITDQCAMQDPGHCVATSGCGFCLTTWTCMPGDDTGPANGALPCPSDYNITKRIDNPQSVLGVWAATRKRLDEINNHIANYIPLR